MKKSPKRKSTRLKCYNYSTPAHYFVTVCVKRHRCIFGYVKNDKMTLNNLGVIARHHLLLLKKEAGISILESIVMPNHIHAIIEILPVGAALEPPGSGKVQAKSQQLLFRVIGKYKTLSARDMNVTRGSIGKAVWQRGYYEHIIRSESALINIRNYILDNPRRWEFDSYYR